MRCALYNAGYFFSSGQQKHRTGRCHCRCLCLCRLLLLLVSSSLASAVSFFALRCAVQFLTFRPLFPVLPVFVLSAFLFSTHNPVSVRPPATLPVCQPACQPACLCNAKNVFSASGFITMFSMYESKFNQFYHLFSSSLCSTIFSYVERAK